MPKPKKGSGVIPSVGDRIVTGLSDLKKALQHRESLTKRFTVRTVELDLEPQDYPPAKVQQIREALNVSQTVFAELLGVSVHAVRSWEQGRREPPKIARRLMDEMYNDPEHWIRLLENAATHREVCV